MIEIHCTKKLLAKLSVDDEGFLPLSRKSVWLSKQESDMPGLLSGWHGNLLTIQRRNCILLVHDETRFPLFIPALKKAHLANLDRWFADALINTLMKCGASEMQLDKCSAALQRLRLDSQCDRSVQGTLNRMGQEIEHILWYDDVNVAEITGYRLAANMANGPCTVKGRKECLWPMKAFLALVDTLPMPVDQAMEPVEGKVVCLADYRQQRRNGGE